MQTPLELLAPDVRAVVNQARALYLRAERFVITTPQEYLDAAEELKSIKAFQKEIAAQKKLILDPQIEAEKATRNLFRAPEDNAAHAETAIKQAIINYDALQEHLRRDAQRVADETARKERERIETQARRAADSGKVEKAEALTERAAAIVPAVLQRDTPKVAGISQRETWSAEVHDLAALVTAVAQGRAPLVILEPNMKFLHGQARSLKNELNYPGVRAKSERGIAAGSAS